MNFKIISMTKAVLRRTVLSKSVRQRIGFSVIILYYVTTESERAMIPQFARFAKLNLRIFDGFNIK